ncbi:uncharacterized protein A4U43_C08F10870 [Asparagus officinalis]|nr:uncharacterized protein A4U43_C08F10870 [Asparagus officinalis]
MVDDGNGDRVGVDKCREFTFLAFHRCFVVVIGRRGGGEASLVAIQKYMLRVGWFNNKTRETTALAVEEDVVGSSTIPEASRRPGKESIGMDNVVEGRAETPSDQIENGADGRILEDMPSVGIH